MYLSFFGLNEWPFRLAPEPRFLYWSEGHKAAMEFMRSACRHPGCSVVTGDRGVGKTTLLEHLLKDEAPRATVTRVNLPPRSPAELQTLLDDAGRQQSDFRLLACDNAHSYPQAVLTAMLREQRTHVLLIGEPPLETSSAIPGLPIFRLPPLQLSEVIAYIACRLAIAGAAGKQIFRSDVCEEIHRETNGNPRLVNALCDAALMEACERELAEVGAAEIRRGLEDVGRLTSARPSTVEPEPVETTPPAEPELPSVVLPARSPLVPVYARLRLLSHGTLLLQRDLPRGQLRVGRGIDNELRIDERYVSRHHCKVVTSEGMSFVQDVQSTNGLYVNHKRVRNHRLCDGDVITIGEHELHYVELRDRQLPR